LIIPFYRFVFSSLSSIWAVEQSYQIRCRRSLQNIFVSPRLNVSCNDQASCLLHTRRWNFQKNDSRVIWNKH
jgi:hypothetical protein